MQKLTSINYIIAKQYFHQSKMKATLIGLKQVENTYKNQLCIQRSCSELKVFPIVSHVNTAYYCLTFLK